MSDYNLSAEITADSSGFTGALALVTEGLESWGLNVEKMGEEGSKVFSNLGVNVDQFAEKLGVSAPMLVGIAAAAQGLACATLV